MIPFRKAIGLGQSRVAVRAGAVGGRAAWKELPIEFFANGCFRRGPLLRRWGLQPTGRIPPP